MTAPVQSAPDETLVRLARQAEERRFGKHRGIVVDTRDPQKRARVRVRVPSVLGDAESDWALPCLPFGGGATHGLFLVPELGAQVWVEFEEGDVNRPIWSGTFWQHEDDVPPLAAVEEPTVRLLETPSGHRLVFDDTNDAWRITLEHKDGAALTLDEHGSARFADKAGAELVLDADAGTARFADANGNSIELASSGVSVSDANGNSIELGAAGITLKGTRIVLDGMVMLGGSGGEPIIKGSTFLTMLATHVHPSAMGPTGPPIPQGEMSSLSSKVMTG